MGRRASREICKQLSIHRSLRRAEPLRGPRGGRARPRLPPAQPGVEPDSSARLRPALLRQTSAVHYGTCSSASPPHMLQKHPGELQNPGGSGKPGAEPRAVGVRARGTWRSGRLALGCGSGRRSLRAARDSRASGAGRRGCQAATGTLQACTGHSLRGPRLCGALAPRWRVEGPIAGGWAHAPRARSLGRAWGPAPGCPPWAVSDVFFFLFCFVPRFLRAGARCSERRRWSGGAAAPGPRAPGADV